MKLSEIFRRLPHRENDAPARKPIEKRPALKTSAIEKIGEIEMLEASVPFEPPRLPLPEGYVYSDATDAARLHAQLLSALTDAHSLFSVPLETFAAREDTGTVLFRFRGNPQRYALVDLSQSTALSADNSGVLFVGTFTEWVQREKSSSGLEPPAR